MAENNSLPDGLEIAAKLFEAVVNEYAHSPVFLFGVIPPRVVKQPSTRLANASCLILHSRLARIKIIDAWYAKNLSQYQEN